MGPEESLFCSQEPSRDSEALCSLS